VDNSANRVFFVQQVLEIIKNNLKQNIGLK